jgi:uncharacterized lipoprotein YmbA
MKRTRLWVLTLGLGGCSVLGPLPDRSRYYTVTSVAPPETAPLDSPAAPPARVYGLGPITVPAYLDRPEVATRVSPTELTYSHTARWAEPLVATVSTALLGDLSARLPNDRVLAYRWAGGEQVDYQIMVYMQRFEPDALGNTLVTAQWLITDPRGREHLVIRDTNIIHPHGPGDADPAAALSATLGALSDEIALELRRLPPPAATTTKRRK